MSANVLVVDDSGVMRGMIKRTLMLSGLDIEAVYEAANGIEALAQMNAHSIGVVLLDINMPVMNGMTLLRRMRDDARLRDIAVVLATSEGSETRIAELMSAGARGYIRKPFHPEHVRDILLPILSAQAPSELSVRSDENETF
jgi:two-component system, chemotaxis family, chemotaxis protein CheY